VTAAASTDRWGQLSTPGDSGVFQEGASFDGERAYEHVKYQVSLGPRPPGSRAHSRTIEWIAGELQQYGWEVEVQEAWKLDHPLWNIVAKRGTGDPWIILGAHYDTRIYADQEAEPGKRNLPVLGANDGASGVAVLLELARTLPENLDKQVWLVFFDGEDNGNVPSWDWILGSQAFVEQLQEKPDAAVILDMIGDADLNIYLERNSSAALSASIWSKAAELGYSDYFIPAPRYSMLDDHTPFVRAGIPAVDIIDFDYPYWHTLEDTADKVSADSLDAVGETMLAWLVNYQ
jgi:Zn-dependent M28 family amino/carboxypeptidase